MAPVSRWTAVVPVKALPAAKSRLASSLASSLGSSLASGSVPPPEHAELVRAMRQDTLAAVSSCPAVARVIVVCDRLTPLDVPATDVAPLIQRSRGLNGAVRDGAAAAHQWPGDGVVALVGDLPALTPELLADVLAAAGRVVRGYVPDVGGSGTTMITALPGAGLDPRFGADSAARHRDLATRLPAAPGARCDVDTLADLLAARELGLGPRTTAALAAVLALAGIAPVGVAGTAGTGGASSGGA
jgi:2-phospho-L-lactate/phosphoenolpyruvate guanylyltransferase